MSSLDDPLIRAQWMNCKKALTDEIDTVKQLDSERRALKESLGNRRPSSPPISTKSSFVFQPLDEYPTSMNAPIDDPDVWAPPNRDNGNRRPNNRSGQMGMRKSAQDPAWARGATRPGPTGRGGKTTNRSGAGVRSSAPSGTGKKGTGSSKSSSSKSESTVSYC